MKKDIKQKTSTLVLITASLVTIVAVLAFVISLATMHRIQAIERDSITTTTKLQADNARLRFCYDEQVFPCDDESIEKWNTANPEDQFNILR